ncbi:MAG: hypothetical protein ACYC0V_05185 [Armatimonadota bacterium]
MASGNSSDGYLPSASMTVKLVNDYTSEARVMVKIGYRRNPLQTNEGIIYWNDKQIAVCHPQSQVEVLEIVSIIADTSKFDFSSGVHRLKITANSVNNSPGYFEIDSIIIEKELLNR